MRDGRKLRHAPAVEAAEAQVSLRPVSADDQPATQLSLDSMGEPADVLVGVTTDELMADSEPAAEFAPAEPVAEELFAEPPDAEPVAQSRDEASAEFSESFVATASDLLARPLPYEPSEPVPVDDASLQMRLARIYLRTGSLAMARAELESLSGRDLLDTPGRLDLAEARWRTGDLHGAGDAAVAYLAANGGEALGFVIAAEAASAGGRHAEARGHLEQARQRMLTDFDSLFAGIPRKAMLPAVGGTTVGPGEAAKAQLPDAPVAAIEPALEPADAVELESQEREVEPPVSGTARTESSAPDGATQPDAAPSRVQAGTEIEAGIALLREGDALLAALHFGVALRITPDSAPAVLSAIDDRHDPALELVRGDALRMLGHEGDADRAYLSVASALSAARGPAGLPVEAPVEPAAPVPPEASQGDKDSEPKRPEPPPLT